MSSVASSTVSFTNPIKEKETVTFSLFQPNFLWWKLTKLLYISLFSQKKEGDNAEHPKHKSSSQTPSHPGKQDSQGLVTMARIHVSEESGSRMELGTKQKALSLWKVVSKQTIITKVQVNKHAATSLSW